MTEQETKTMNNRKEVSRISVSVHNALSSQAIEIFKELGLKWVTVEGARCVRQMLTENIFGQHTSIVDSRTDIFRITVERKCAYNVLCYLVNKLDLDNPGRGSAYCQNMVEISDREVFSSDTIEAVQSERLLKDLTLITGIQSKSSSGKNLNRVALKLGAGVPIVSPGIGTGIRDKLGLLRITITPEKEMMYLIVPSHDADGLQQLLIEEGRLNRPGAGFLYQTPLTAGIADPLLRIGMQRYAASLEQIIAAIDDLKKSTAWRKRFFSLDNNINNKNKKNCDCSHREINFQCLAERSDEYIQAAMSGGAAGATTTRMRKLILDSENENESMENAIICVPAEKEEEMIGILNDLAKMNKEQNWAIQSLPASSVFVHKRSKK